MPQDSARLGGVAPSGMGFVTASWIAYGTIVMIVLGSSRAGA